MENLFAEHDCTTCERRGDCPLEGVIDWAIAHKEEIDGLEHDLDEYVQASAKTFVHNLLSCSSSQEATRVVLDEVISNVVLGYVRARMKQEQIDVPDVFKELDNE